MAADPTQIPNTIYFSQESPGVPGTLHLGVGTQIVVDDPTQRFEYSPVVQIAGGTDTAGGLGSWQNTIGVSVIVHNLFINITAIATAACTLSAGETATNATTLSSNLISGGNVHALGVIGNYSASIGAGQGVVVPAGAWITFSTASGASAGLVATAYIDYRPL